MLLADRDLECDGNPAPPPVGERPPVTVRSRLPWPIRWLVLALMMGGSAAVAVWTYEYVREIAGLGRDAGTELRLLRESSSGCVTSTSARCRSPMPPTAC